MKLIYQVKKELTLFKCSYCNASRNSGYAAMKAPTSYNYNTISEYIENGIAFAYAGCRGRYEGGETYIAGAPWPVTDLKSAIRYLKYNKNILPGSTDKIYSFGMSGGGAQSCLM